MPLLRDRLSVRRGAGSWRSSGTAALLLATASFRATQNMTQTTLSLLGRSVGFNGTAIGAIAAGANLLGVITMLLVTARLATGHARRAVVVALAFITASLVGFLIPAEPALLAGAAMLGIAGGLGLPSVATAIGDHASSTGDAEGSQHESRVKTARALARLGVVLSISLTLGPLYESLVLTIAHERLRVAYLAFLPVAILGLVAISGRGPAGDALPMPPATLRESLTGLGALFRNRRWGLAMCAEAIYTVPFTVVIVFAGLLGHNLYHTSAATTELGITLFFSVSFLCRAALTRRPAVGHRIHLFGLCVVATLCGIALLALGAGVAVFMVALAVLGAPHGLTYPLALGLVADSVSNAELSHANAAFAAVSEAISVVAPLILGVVASHFGDREMLLSAIVPVTLLAGLLWHLRDAG